MRKPYIDETVAHSLQRRYREGEERALSLLYLEIRRMAGLILERTWNIQNGKIDEYSHDAATQIMLKYMKNPEYKIGRFYNVVRLFCLEAIEERQLNGGAGHRDRAKTQAHTDWVDLDKVIIKVEPETPEEDDPALLDGLSAYFRLFSWYRPAIKGLMPYISKDWMRAHAVQLRDIFRRVQSESSDEPVRGRKSKGAGRGNG